MEDKIWYRLPTSKPYELLEGVINISYDSTDVDIKLIQSCIDIFNKSITWNEMWTISQALERIQNGEELFIYAPENEAKAFVWFRDNYLYNFFVAPEVRKYGIGEKLIKHAYNILPYSTFYAYTERWNKVTQNFTKKRVGGIEIYSYL